VRFYVISEQNYSLSSTLNQFVFAKAAITQDNTHLCHDYKAMTVRSSRNDTALAKTLLQYANVFRPGGHVGYLVNKNDIEGGVNKNEVEDSFVVAREVEEDSEKFKSFYGVSQESFKYCVLLSKQDLSFIQNAVFPNKVHKFNIFFFAVVCTNTQGILNPVSSSSYVVIYLRLSDRRQDMLSTHHTLSACREHDRNRFVCCMRDPM
jgi:hypothetical protein